MASLMVTLMMVALVLLVTRSVYVTVSPSLMTSADALFLMATATGWSGTAAIAHCCAVAPAFDHDIVAFA